jgi:rfaE bifunctional protein nucleotidyltransferase chain/domain
MDENRKIMELDALAEVLARLQGEGKRIVHCHGCFDLMHPGHIKYFQAARRMGDVLVVTLSPDRFVDKGPGRPVYHEGLRAESIAALQCVDYVAVNRWPTAEETLRLLRPHVYVKGQEFERLEDATGKIQREAEVVREIGAELAFTHEIVFSSTHLINTHLRTREP